jgi:hypothetical protein
MVMVMMVMVMDAASDAKPEEDTFTSRLLASIIDNVQVEIYNVHVRYEDDRNPEQFFSAGITLERSVRYQATFCSTTVY